MLPPLFYLFFSLIFISFSTQAEIYQWFDSHGKPHYSDKAHRGASTLQLNTKHSYYQIKKIYDGDTILLTNGIKVRFLGINTPEVERRHKPAQPGGEKAKRWLTQQLKNKKVRLEKDVEKKDKYGRTLAYIFTEDELNINLELLRKGLASINIYPPNLKYTKQFIAAEKQAERNKLGIWQYSEYAPKNALDLNKKHYNGWQRINGQISNIRHSRKYSYLNFSNHFAIKIDRKLDTLFPNLDEYIGKKVQVRGWINKRKNHYSILVRHPSSIILQQ